MVAKPSDGMLKLSEAQLASLRVLIVDDHADTLQIISVFLDLWGCIARTSTRGEDALALAEEFNPHVILLDFRLPDIDGIEVLRRLENRFGQNRPKVIAFTAAGRGDDRRLIEAGFDLH